MEAVNLTLILATPIHIHVVKNFCYFQRSNLYSVHLKVIDMVLPIFESASSIPICKDFGRKFLQMMNLLFLTLLKRTRLESKKNI